MDTPEKVEYGRKVRTTSDYEVTSLLGIQPGDEITIGDSKMKINHKKERQPNPIIPAGSVGVIKEGSYSGILDYKEGCPVQFGIDDPMVPETLGVPWGILEYAD